MLSPEAHKTPSWLCNPELIEIGSWDLKNVLMHEAIELNLAMLITHANIWMIFWLWVDFFSFYRNFRSAIGKVRQSDKFAPNTLVRLNAGQPTKRSRVLSFGILQLYKAQNKKCCGISREEVKRSVMKLRGGKRTLLQPRGRIRLS